MLRCICAGLQVWEDWEGRGTGAMQGWHVVELNPACAAYMYSAILGKGQVFLSVELISLYKSRNIGRAASCFHDGCL
jgi:hypothetical protein